METASVMNVYLSRCQKQFATTVVYQDNVIFVFMLLNYEQTNYNLIYYGVCFTFS